MRTRLCLLEDYRPLRSPSTPGSDCAFHRTAISVDSLDIIVKRITADALPTRRKGARETPTCAHERIDTYAILGTTGPNDCLNFPGLGPVLCIEQRSLTTVPKKPPQQAFTASPAHTGKASPERILAA
jgi:hypothetical protein